MPLFQTIGRWTAHALFQPERVKRKVLNRHCAHIKNCKVLEIGSGCRVDGKPVYSVAGFFERNDNTVTLSDIEPEFGHTVVDITQSVPAGHDVIVCFNVLEHVSDFSTGIANLYEALSPGGQLLIYVPMFYPLHDEPHDYFRYTEHALRKILGQFADVEIHHFGVREFPLGYFVRATR